MPPAPAGAGNPARKARREAAAAGRQPRPPAESRKWLLGPRGRGGASLLERGGAASWEVPRHHRDVAKLGPSEGQSGRPGLRPTRLPVPHFRLRCCRGWRWRAGGEAGRLRVPGGWSVGACDSCARSPPPGARGARRERKKEKARVTFPLPSGRSGGDSRQQRQGSSSTCELPGCQPTGEGAAGRRQEAGRTRRPGGGGWPSRAGAQLSLAPNSPAFGFCSPPPPSVPPSPETTGWKAWITHSRPALLAFGGQCKGLLQDPRLAGAGGRLLGSSPDLWPCPRPPTFSWRVPGKLGGREEPCRGLGGRIMRRFSHLGRRKPGPFF